MQKILSETGMLIDRLVVRMSPCWSVLVSGSPLGLVQQLTCNEVINHCSVKM